MQFNLKAPYYAHHQTVIFHLRLQRSSLAWLITKKQISCVDGILQKMLCFGLQLKLLVCCILEKGQKRGGCEVASEGGTNTKFWGVVTKLEEVPKKDQYLLELYKFLDLVSRTARG